MKPILSVMIFALLAVSISSCAQKVKTDAPKSEPVVKVSNSQKDLSKYKQATFAAGCFWCEEAVFESVKGVQKAISGYAGGQTKNPTYEQVETGTTGHAESVNV